MKKQHLIYISVGAAALIILILFLSSVFIVSEIDQAIVTQFGRPVRVIAGLSSFTDKDAIQKSVDEYSSNSETNIQLSYGAGLYFKIPFIQTVEFFDDRILEYDSEATQVTTSDKKRILIDNFARWKIYDPLRFRQRVTNVFRAQSQLDDIIYSQLRSELGEHELINIVRSTDNILQDEKSTIPEQKLIPVKDGRVVLMERVTERCRKAALEYGILIIDVRIKRADLPDENLQAVYNNMRAERERIATKYREEGNRDSAIIKAETDRTVKTMKAEADRQAQVIQGEADAEAIRIYANGFIKSVTNGPDVIIKGYESDPVFYKFIRSLEALELALDEQTNLLLDTNNDLLRYLNRQTPE